MIRSIKFTGGYASGVGTLRKQFTFKPGVNVLFGPNGSGKSTIIKTLAKYGFTRAGWTTWEWSVLGHAFASLAHGSDGADERDMMNEYLTEYQHRNDCMADVDIDGPVFLCNEEFYDGSGVPLAASGIGQGAMHNIEALLLRMDGSRMSTGENRRAELNSMIDRISKTAFTLGERPDDTDGRNAMRVFLYDYISAHRVGGCDTFLMDEPDRTLDLPTAAMLYREVIPSYAAAGAQVIVATHSPFALVNSSFNLIDVKRGYIRQCRKSLEVFSAVK